MISVKQVATCMLRTCVCLELGLDTIASDLALYTWAKKRLCQERRCEVYVNYNRKGKEQVKVLNTYTILHIVMPSYGVDNVWLEVTLSLPCTDTRTEEHNL